MTSPAAPGPSDLRDRPPVSSADVGLYVHFPYCEKKCPYCDFNVHAVPHDDRLYADAIIREIDARAPAFFARARAFSTIYFGGGTPSEWAPDEVGRVIRFARERFGLKPGGEITLEANPGTVAAERLHRFVELGVTRFSLGVQSFIDPELEALGRSHSAVEAERIVTIARSTGAEVSIDLIFGLPGQSEDDLFRSIDRAIAVSPEHVSAYTLTVEPKTALGRRARLGLFQPMEDDRQADLIDSLAFRLAKAGLARYEVSSYARPGKEAVHNTIYWVGGPYLGAGAGAHSYLPGPGLKGASRRENKRAPAEYIEEARLGLFRPEFEEALEERDAIAERMIVGVRTRWGFDLDALAREAGLDGPLQAAVEPAIAGLEQAGLLARASDRVRPTARGFLFTDLIARRLWEGIEVLRP